ncbi:MAG: glycosyltransferase family 9 protein, partial [Nitrospirae bacterium]
MSGARVARALIWLLSFASQTARGPREQPAPEEVSRIVVLHMSGIGDLLLMTPALRALRRLYPRAHIDLITYRLSNAAFLFRLPAARQECEFPLFDLDLKSAWTPGF